MPLVATKPDSAPVKNTLIVLGMIWGLLFVSQPLEQAPNDAAFIDLMSTIVVFLTGTLSGLVASNGIKNKTAADD